MTSEREQLEQAIAALEGQRVLLGDLVVEAALAPMRQKLARLAGPAAERRLVTILFADLVGFTSLAETVDAEAARDLMNELFEVLVPSIERYEGTVDKFIGDEIMALFGAPVAHENDPERALRAALEMQAALADFNRRRGSAIGMHFGVNTGLVIAGGIGSRGRQDYSVLGDAVNLAARLTAAAGPGEIFVGPDTRRLTAALFDFAPLPPLALKGKQEPLLAFRLRGLRAAPDSPRGLREMAAPMVGRDGELGRLRAALAALRAGQGGRVLILGEAGLGKSRLVAEARAAAPDGVAWAEGRALAHTGGMSYWVARDLLRRLLGAPADQQPERVGALLRERLLALAPERIEALYPPLARLLDVPLSGAVRAADSSASQIGSAFAALLAAWSADQPLALVWEDLHWADRSSLGLLEAVLALAATAPVLVIGVSRPDPEHRWPAAWDGAALELAPLKDQESADLVRYLLRIDRLPETLRGLMLAKAEGNPFFLEELIRSLMDAGMIVRQGDQFVAAGAVDALALPDTLQGLIMARIDRLPPVARTVLQTAAVLGRAFDRRVLRRLVADKALDDAQLDAALETLLDHAFIRLPEAAAADPGYIFKHIIIQETAYQGLLLQQRRTLHRQAGEAFEALFPERLEELDATLAYHFGAAGEWRKAARYLRQAGHHARGLGALDEALGFYRSALALLKRHADHEAAARVALTLGQAYQAALDEEQARAAYQEGFALWAAASASQPAAPPSAHPLRLLGGEPDQVDPALVDNLWSVMIASNLFRNLVSLTPDGGFEPDIAHSWEILDGGTRYVFALTDTAFWSDGAPLTAHDVVYAWRRLLDPGFASSLGLLLYDIRGARGFHQGLEGAEPGFRALDDHTLEVELEQPTSHFLSILTTPATFPVPRHVVERVGAGWSRHHLVTSGPFTIEEWVSDQRIVLIR
ncbi:MAG TPA: ABC transporter substrate-binding protein, partial [Herpetosiphonaceae bacterium]|nr:ABC transporter substrate-binding protein [Herpetosiphonaceae bacterium]